MSLISSGSPLCSSVPMMPTPVSIAADLDRLGVVAERHHRAMRRAVPASGRKIALSVACSRSLAWSRDPVHDHREVER